MTTSPNLAMTLVDAAQSQKHVTINEALGVLDATVQLSVVSRTLTTPPVSPGDGDRYLVAAGATGAWAGQSEKIAAYMYGAWYFLVPKTGWLTFVVSENTFLYYVGNSWSVLGFGISQTVNYIGADGPERLARGVILTGNGTTIISHGGNNYKFEEATVNGISYKVVAYTGLNGVSGDYHHLFSFTP